jgi:putative Mg2+ transporter-C (MgtC) family protein
VELIEFFLWLIDSLLHRSDEALRLLLACALGGWIGLEREASGKPAGFRTNLIICLGAALVTEISIAVSHGAIEEGAGALIADPGRIAAQVVSGIGFLGAGTIIQSRGSVTGLTTAATLWVVAMIGIGVGAQAYLPAVLGTVLVVTALRVLDRVDDYLFPSVRGAHIIEVTLKAQPGAVQRLAGRLGEAGATVLQVDVARADDRVVATLRVRGLEERATTIAEDLIGSEEVLGVSLR